MMKPIAVSQLSDNFFETISKEWMLVTAGNKDAFNTMTANWGGIGFLWNKPVVYVFIRPERYTFGFMEKSDYFTLSFLGEENKSIHKICGSKSGREVDKIKETGLKPMITDKGNVLFEQGRLSLECRKLYTDLRKIRTTGPGCRRSRHFHLNGPYPHVCSFRRLILPQPPLPPLSGRLQTG
mgnify:FL=1